MNLFDSPRMAEGYARFRPCVHPHVVERIRRGLGLLERVRLALDVGCGAGLSTAALAPIAARAVGLEPGLNLLGWSRQVAPGAEFVAGRAEALPFRAGCVDLIAAAGSLNWSDLGLFLDEARRVVAGGGALVIYDFSEGRSFPDSRALEEWFQDFQRRYPSPPCLEVSPGTLRPELHRFRQAGYEEFEVALPLDPEFYLEYMLTETNVAAAIQAGTPESEIREWCRRTLAPVFDGRERQVLFRGFILYLAPD